MADAKKPEGLALLRVPFEQHQISKLPKPTKAQSDAVKADYKKGIRCKICGGWHHPDVVHLDYVGHAALTDRLLDCDPEWNWEPMSIGPNGAPLLDENGGMWIRLTVCGVSRLGYGHPDGKRGGDAIKEVIGDALRNAAMRFGAALDLWHKGSLHLSQDDGPDAPEAQEKPKRDLSPHPEPEHTLDWSDILEAPSEGVTERNSAQSKADWKALRDAIGQCQGPAELARFVREAKDTIWSLHPTARHYLREAYDTTLDNLMADGYEALRAPVTGKA